jgi:hypothetical protein
MGTAASVISLIGEGVSIVGYIREGKWEEAASQAAEMVVDAAPLLLGSEVAGPLAGVVILVKAEMQAIHSAAEFTRHCKDAQVREAVENYVVEGLIKHVQPWAAELTANVELMLDGTQPESVQRVAMGKVNEDAENTWKGVVFVAHSYLEPLAHLSGDVYASMGAEAYGVFGEDLSMPSETKDGVNALVVADKVGRLFHGANLMAKYVYEHYRN